MMRALSFDKEDRPATAAELQADIEAYLAEHERPVPARAIGRLVVSLFEDVDTHTKEVIERQLMTLREMEDQRPTLDQLPIVRVSSPRSSSRTASRGRRCGVPASSGSRSRSWAPSWAWP